MAKGDLAVQITDTAGEPVRTRVDIDLVPFSGGPGAGGEPMNVSLNLGSSIDLMITGITCRGGPGTVYRLLFTARHFRPYGFFRLIREDNANIAGDDVEFWVRPRDVADIRAPKFDDLPAHLRTILNDAQMIADKPEDRDLVGSSCRGQVRSS